MEEEVDAVLRTIKSRKAEGLNEIPPVVWKTRIFDDILLRLYNAKYKQNRRKAISSPNPHKRSL